jgi:hypothetical protein
MFNKPTLIINPPNSGLIQQLRAITNNAIAIVLTTFILMACGGGGSGKEMAVVEPPTALHTTVPGAYLGSLDGKEWVSILIRSAENSSNFSNFYGMHYNSPDPDIYSASGEIFDLKNTSINRINFFPNTSGTVRSGSGTFTNLGHSTIRAVFNFPVTGLEQEKNVAVNASVPSTYQYNLPANLANVQGVWQGRWSYGVGFADNFALNISAQGTMTSASAFQQDCLFTKSSLRPNFDGTNLFTFTLAIPNATQCSLKNQILNGAAFVTISPVVGKSSRLYIIGVTSDGKGVSFRSDR